RILGGAVKAYAVTSAERLEQLPDLPTTAEGGLASMQFGIWHGIYAPKGTDAAIVDRLSQSLQGALQDQNVIDRFAALATAPEPQENATPAALKAKVESEIVRWKPLIEAAGVYAD
ncbi:MAG: tripartite tricarboxylate transporter substrate binding protein BugD, partial [Aquamicrobium sp.]|nr:tripartite tricarboxylate transporter substrate binding protein BugD [Aquamicrobium sp.]